MISVGSSLWRKQAAGFPPSVSRLKIPLSRLVFYVPLWHPELAGSPFISKDLNAHSCTVFGAVWTPQGRAMDGTDDYIKVPNATSLDLEAGNFTLQAWIYPTSLPESNAVIMSSLDSTPLNPRYFQLNLKATELRFDMKGSSGSTDTYWTVGDLLNKWSHIVVVRTGTTTIAAYLNGALLSEQTINVGDITNSLPILLGRMRNNDVWNYPFAGIIGEAKMYKGRAWVEAEVQNDRNSTKWRYS